MSTKGPIKFDITLSEEQKEAKRKMMNSTCSLIDGEPGCAKTTLCMNVALDLLFKGDIDKIYCTRPPIELIQFNKFGSLPGDMGEKNQVYMQPFLDAIESNYGNTSAKKAKITKCIKENKIVFFPLPFLRGRNLGTKSEKCVVLLDEGQTCSNSTLYTILTRIGEGSKLFITMDLNQSDSREISGVKRLKEIAPKIDGLEFIELKQNYRSKFVQQINKNWF